MRAGRISPFVAALAVLATTTMTPAGAQAPPDPVAPRADGPPEGAVVFLPQDPGDHAVAVWDGVRTDVDTGEVDQALVGRFGSDGFEDVLAYRPGAGASSWLFGGAESTPDGPAWAPDRQPASVSGRYIPLVGDFGGPVGPGGSSIDDVLWYAPGPTPDTLLLFPPVGGALKYTVRVDGRYRPFVLEGDGTEPEAIVWYAPGRGADSIWDFRDVPWGGRRTRAVRIDGDYRPTSFATDEARLVHWYDADGHDSTWRMVSNGPADLRFADVKTYQYNGRAIRPIAIDLGDTAGVFLYGRGPAEDITITTLDASGTSLTSTAVPQVWGDYPHVVAGDVTSATPGVRDGVDELIFGGVGTRATMWRFTALHERVVTTYTGLPAGAVPAVVATDEPLT